jgi:hypothetical protein
MKFLLSELLRTIVRSWRLVGWVLGGAVIAALAFVIFLILWVARGEWGENRLIVLFEPGVSGEQIRQVYRQVREWEAISEVLYITRDDPRLAQDGVDPERAPAGYLRVTVRHASQAAEAQAALRDLPGVAAVQSYQKGALRTLIASDSGVRTAVTLLQIGASGSLYGSAFRGAAGASGRVAGRTRDFVSFGGCAAGSPRGVLQFCRAELSRSGGSCAVCHHRGEGSQLCTSMGAGALAAGELRICERDGAWGSRACGDGSWGFWRVGSREAIVASEDRLSLNIWMSYTPSRATTSRRISD